MKEDERGRREKGRKRRDEGKKEMKIKGEERRVFISLLDEE